VRRPTLEHNSDRQGHEGAQHSTDGKGRGAAVGHPRRGDGYLAIFTLESPDTAAGERTLFFLSSNLN